MVQTAQSEHVISRLAQVLGEGWTAVPFSGSGDGQLTGPGGEKVWVKLYLGEASLHIDLQDGAEAPTIRQRVTNGEALDFMAQAIAEAFPVWAEAHKQDLRRQKELPGAQEAFARAVADHLGEGWSGGVEGYWNSLKVYVTKGDLRIQWQPVGFAPKGADKLAERLNLSAFGGPSITVSSKRTAKAVASEITRRLLPGYLADLQAADEEKARHKQAVADVVKIVALVEKHGAAFKPFVRGYNQDHTGETVDVDLSAFDLGGATLHGEAQCRAGGAYLKIEVGKLDAAGLKIMLGALAKAAAKLAPAEGDE